MSVASKPVPLARSRFVNVRQAYDLALAGALGAIFGLYLYVELVRADSVLVRDALAGVAIGGTIGFFLNAAGPFRDGAWIKLSRASTWGALAGAAGGALGLVLGESVIGWFQGGLVGRALSWAVLGLGIGVSQGLAERSRQRLVYGLLGGGLGGLVGGYLFEWLRQSLGHRYNNSLGQGLGIVILGAGLGLFLALVEQVLRRAWIQVISGRQEGRVYLLARKVSALGLDERAEVGLFGDRAVARRHAEIESTAKGYVLRNHAPSGRTRVNGTVIDDIHILSNGDRIELGQTMLVFRQR
ncbi:FHA domain-containing protein [Singulisphaera sp. Ch08]|uniref:FHA domain-containing protein n=1 Tax=Singulisphaera sp. Ch08 TaxID=3120278 RepID=A0AAU7CF86_9BACT